MELEVEGLTWSILFLEMLIPMLLENSWWSYKMDTDAINIKTILHTKEEQICSKLNKKLELQIKELTWHS